ncbi:MAG: hypothetical protein LBO05_06220 [Deltaproteobacteria bacterium]|jgi:hypothetical protein|nr:hypothetical protein [Deltaproteobacteria bacterium]
MSSEGGFKRSVGKKLKFSGKKIAQLYQLYEKARAGGFARKVEETAERLYLSGLKRQKGKKLFFYQTVCGFWHNAIYATIIKQYGNKIHGFDLKNACLVLERRLEST